MSLYHVGAELSQEITPSQRDRMLAILRSLESSPYSGVVITPDGDVKGWSGPDIARAVDWYEEVIAGDKALFAAYYRQGDPEPITAYRRPSDAGTITITTTKADWLGVGLTAGAVGLAVGLILKGK